MGHAERRGAGARDEEDALADPNRGARGNAHERLAHDAGAARDLDAVRAEQEPPERRQRAPLQTPNQPVDGGERSDHGAAGLTRSFEPESVVVTGPISPQDVAHLLDGAAARWARKTVGYRGVPTSELVVALVKAGLAVEAVTTASEVEQPIVLEGPRFRLLVAPLRPCARERALDLFRAERRHLRSLLRLTEGTVVHAFWTYEFAWAALEAGRPLVITAHDAPLTILRNSRDLYRAFRVLMAYLVRSRARHLTAVSPYLARQWRRQMLYRREIAVVPNLAPRLPAVEARGDDAPRSLPLVVDVADGSPWKNVASLVRAVDRVNEVLPRVRLAVAGHGLGRDDELPRRLAADGCGRTVDWLGPLSRGDIAALLASASVFVHASREESFGLTVVEAMSFGLPVVAGRDSGALPWVLEDGKAGLLVDVSNPSAIAAGIVELLESNETARALGERARRRANDFSPERVVDAYLRIYAAACSAKRSGREALP